VDTDLDTLATALFVKTDDLLKATPQPSEALATVPVLKAARSRQHAAPFGSVR
jgi:hypothetical protein